MFNASKKNVAIDLGSIVIILVLLCAGVAFESHHVNCFLLDDLYTNLFVCFFFSFLL